VKWRGEERRGEERRGEERRGKGETREEDRARVDDLDDVEEKV